MNKNKCSESTTYFIDAEINQSSPKGVIELMSSWQASFTFSTFIFPHHDKESCPPIIFGAINNAR
jgi:hypothetical protein